MTMEQRPDPRRTKDTIEQLEDEELTNPITDEEAEIAEAGDAMSPEGEGPLDKDEAEGPVPHTTQMPR